MEVGCGLGLPGVAALARGLRVTFSDYDPAALEFAARNARLNQLENFCLLRLDWHAPPEEPSLPRAFLRFWGSMHCFISIFYCPSHCFLRCC